MNFSLASVGMACILGMGGLGSGIGAGIAGQAAIGAWKRSYMSNKPASFLLVAFAGAPLTQTIYSFILVLRMAASSKDPLYIMMAGIFSGASIGISAVAQGMCSASACDAYGETGKGFGSYITVVGLTETVAIFTLLFTLVNL
jgi:V/A-type H+-transporting ATPase subunit K